MDYSEVIELEKKLLNSSVRKSPEELNRLLSDDFFEIGTSGRTYNKKIVMENLALETPSIVEAIDFKVIEIARNVVQLRFKTIRKDNDGSVSASLRSSIWRSIGNEWQMIFHQGTRTIP